jgi:hypothetical protein
LRIIEVITPKVKPSKVNKLKKAACGVDRTMERTTSEVKANNIASVLITLDAIP